MSYQYAEQTTMGATATSASEKQSHRALQDSTIVGQVDLVYDPKGHSFY